jgi:endonuclease YncB( thermonuclease family)
MFGYKTPLKTLSFIFVLAFLSSSLHAQQTTTVVRIVDGDTLKVRYWGKDEKHKAYWDRHTREQS